MKRILFSLTLFLSAAWLLAQVPQPKREFRGAWIQAVNGQFQGMTPDAMRQNLTHQLDELRACGINVIIFQVRPECDALYASPYEPWSRFLSGKQGEAPSPYWDPLQWMIEQCHNRGMELHAWINPFRAKTKGTKNLAALHPYMQHPDRFFNYDGLYILDPGIPQNREYTCRVAADIVRRYDVDGLHIDDYFYPYPAAGKKIPDEETFRRYHNGFPDVEDWRRYNVNVFIQALNDSIHNVKPWVKFGVSPFGIYHNAKSGSSIPGSNTAGLQNYDDLYADILFWMEKGWVDYLVPQIYWEIGHKTADYETLIQWWARHASNRVLVIGQDVERTVKAPDLENPQINQMPAKYRLQRTLRGVQGSCQWYSAAVVRNEGGYATALKQAYHRTPALQPRMPHLDNTPPKKPSHLRAMWMPDGYYLFWTAPKAKTEMDEAKSYVVYRFAPGQKRNLENADNIVCITREKMLKLPYHNGRTKYTYVVTALDRLQNESKGAKVKVKL